MLGLVYLLSSLDSALILRIALILPLHRVGKYRCFYRIKMQLIWPIKKLKGLIICLIDTTIWEDPTNEGISDVIMRVF